MFFKNREDAGRQLAQALGAFKEKKKTLVLGLARGGVVVAAEIAKSLKLPLQVVVPRKIGAPGNPELALGAIMEDGSSYFDQRLVNYLGATKSYLDDVIEKEKKEAKRRIDAFRGKRGDLEIKGHTVILVDDGIATGSTMMAVIKSMRAKEAAQIIVAVPIASIEASEMIAPLVDQFISLGIPPFFGAVGSFYEHFDQTEDTEVIKLLSG